MRYFFTILIGIFIYVGCANNSSTTITTEESIEIALENEDILESWNSKENRTTLLELLRKADLEGLNPEDYHYSDLTRYEDAILLTPSQIEDYHKLLTESIIKYSSHLRNGKINPNEIYDDWEIKPKPIINDSLLTVVLSRKKIDSLIEASKPKHSIYNNLKKALAVLKTMPDDHFDSIKHNEKIYFGVKNKTIAKIKERLRYWGDLNNSDTLNNTLFDKALKKAIIKFQIRHGLESDGKVGNGTLSALNFSKENRLQQLIVNLERWRWFPEQLGNNFLAVNLPDYNLQVVENNDTIQAYKVVVGQVKRKTPILSSKVENIIFNPTWTIPPTIIKEDLIPDATKDKNYFYKTKVKIFDYKNNEIPVYKWKPEDALNYKYVQDPGYNNSLGVVKINFINSHLVYMHDTNHRELFVKNYRALSSGCVRIEKPLPLAEYLLKDKLKKEKVKELVPQKGKQKTKIPVYKTKWKEIPIYSLAEIDTIIQEKDTKVVTMSQTFGVHFLYFTAWYNNGILQFRHDVYEYDKELYLRLSNKFTSNLITSARVIDK